MTRVRDCFPATPPRCSFRAIGTPLAFGVSLLWATCLAQAQNGADAEQQQTLLIVAAGDSITKGVRPGVDADAVFTAVLHKELLARGHRVEMVNAGIGGERTDQALQRFDTLVAPRPRYVTLMYGTNDSYVDEGQTESRLSRDAFRTHLENIIAQLLLAGSEPILMTPPRWAGGSRNGVGEDPNLRLAPYADICRHVARACQVPLVDHFAHWTRMQENGVDLRDWTTDGCHPNARGHAQLAAAILPVLLESLRPVARPRDYRLQVDTILEHDDEHFLWFHPRAAAFPGDDARHPGVLLTLQKHLRTSDHYSGLHFMLSYDLGRTWTTPQLPAELDWVREGNVNVAVADVTPLWAPRTRRVLAVGAEIRYGPEGQQLEDQRRSHQTAYALFDPAQRAWTRWRRLEMPPEARFDFARCACAQFLCESHKLESHLSHDSFLLPLYIGASATVPAEVVVARGTLVADELTFQQHGNILQLPTDRGLCEPSLICFQDRYFLTIRHDRGAYVTVSRDGLHYRPIQPWQFDDGEPLGSYNTQQHWLAHGQGLFLVYTRRGANNDHVIRHRAPLFLAQVDPGRLCVLRQTERILIPERGATMGNFGAAALTDQESWVTVSEGVWNNEARQRGATGATFVARVLWSDEP